MRQIDAVHSRLGGLKERIEATEACMALDLDHRRNELVAFNLVSHHLHNCMQGMHVLSKLSGLCICVLRTHEHGNLIGKVVLQALTIFSVAITWVAMTASIFGQNLYFSNTSTPLVRAVSSLLHSLGHLHAQQDL